jgi:hypothetical protein
MNLCYNTNSGLDASSLVSLAHGIHRKTQRRKCCVCIRWIPDSPQILSSTTRALLLSIVTPIPRLSDGRAHAYDPWRLEQVLWAEIAANECMTVLRQVTTRGLHRHVTGERPGQVSQTCAHRMSGAGLATQTFGVSGQTGLPKRWKIPGRSEAAWLHSSNLHLEYRRIVPTHLCLHKLFKAISL